MRRVLVAGGLMGVIALGPAFGMAAPAAADTTAPAYLATETPNVDDDNDDTGKWGLAGLTGLLGLFGYKKYKEHRAADPDRPGSQRGI